MKKGKCIIFSMLILLGLVTLVQASAIDANKVTDPVNPNIYHIGDTIDYAMTVTNPVSNIRVNYLDDIYDTEPNGNVVTFVPPPDYITQNPGDFNQYFLSYVVSESDLVFIPEFVPLGIPAHMAVVDTFHASGIDSATDIVSIDVQRNSTIIEPCIDVNKTVTPTVSMPGQDVVYTIEICNCGDTNLTLIDINDTIFETLDDIAEDLNATCAVLDGGVYDGQGVLQKGECCTTQFIYTIQPDDPDPLCNIVCVTGEDQLGGPAGTVQDCDPACVDLVVPDVNIEKSCPEYSKAGDEITYEVCITNTGETDLQILNVEDDVAEANQICVGEILAPQGSCCFTYPYTVQQGDPDPLINTVSVIAAVVDADVNVSDSTVCETALLHPDFDVNKVCLTEPVEGDLADFRITIENTGDVNLIITTDEPELPGPLEIAIGQIITVDVNRAVIPGAGEVNNTVNVTATLPPVYELPNVINKSANATCSIPGDEGCTPGFWKNSPLCWDCYSTGQTLGSVFTIPCGSTYGTGSNCLANKTMMQALKFRGGRSVRAKARIMLRHAVAALLNACNPDVQYSLSEGAIIAAVNDAIASEDKDEILSVAGMLGYYNEYGCPISSDNSSHPCQRNGD